MFLMKAPAVSREAKRRIAPRAVANVLSLAPKWTDTEKPLPCPLTVAPLTADAPISSRRTVSLIVFASIGLIILIECLNYEKHTTLNVKHRLPSYA